MCDTCKSQIAIRESNEANLSLILLTSFAQRVPQAGRLIVAQRFSAGITPHDTRKSAKRTTEILPLIQPSVSRTATFGSLAPSTKVLGYYQSSASPT
jgi:hypothetical protein